MDYDISDLDDNGILKPGPFLLLTIVILSRQIFYGPLALLAQRKGGRYMDVSWMGISSYWEFLACLPAVVVLFLVFKRNAGAADWVKSTWSRGRILLLVAALLQIGALALSSGLGHFSPSMPMLVLLIIQLYLLGYLWRAQRVKDVFSAFPTK